MAETALNDFVKYETKKIEDYDITFLEGYISDTINKAGDLRKELENYVKRIIALTPELHNKAEPFLAEHVEVSVKTLDLKPIIY